LSIDSLVPVIPFYHRKRDFLVINLYNQQFSMTENFSYKKLDNYAVDEKESLIKLSLKRIIKKGKNNILQNKYNSMK